MTDKEKAKAYDEAIRKAAILYKASEPMSACNVIIETLFPELKESEDERIRKALINGFKDYKGWDEEWFDGITVRKAIAWLEKQGEQKPAEWSEEDERMYRRLHNLIYSTQYCDSRKELSDWLKSIKQRIGG